MSISYIISKEYRGKRVKIPKHWRDNVSNDELILNIPSNAYHLYVEGMDPYDEQGNPIDCDDQLDQIPFLIYLDDKKQNIMTTDLLSIDTFSLDSRLQLILEEYH